MFKNKFEKKIKKIFEWNWWWEFRSRLKWEWVEITDWRKYVPWDDLKSINWKLTAKTGEIYVNLYETLKDVDFHIFLDINTNRFAVVGDGPIWENLTKELNQIFDWFVQKKARIKLFWYQDNKLKSIKVQTKGHLLLPFKSARKSYTYSTNLDKFLAYQMGYSKRRLILVFSDFLGLEDEQARKLKVLGGRNELFLRPILPFKSFVAGKNFDFVSFNLPSFVDELKEFWI